MRRQGNPPFEIGTTLSGSNSNGDTIHDEYLGVTWDFKPKNTISNLVVSIGDGITTAIALRNNSGGALLGGRFVSLENTAGYSPVQKADGYSDTLAQGGLVLVDPDLDSNGVADGDIFWGFIKGPKLCKTPTVGADFNGDIAVGGPLVASTGSTSGSTSEGRVSNVTFANATAGNTTVGLQAYSMAKNHLGRALSAKTTGNTDADILVNLEIVI